MLLAIFLTFVLMVSGADRVTADIIHVPGEFPTIQQAVDHSSPGDEIVIDAGTYNENVSMIGREGLLLRSQSGPALTIVDGNLLDAVFGIEYCQRITIEGLGIRRGRLGVRIHDSGGVRVAGCVVEENVSLGDGGGFSVIGSHVVIEDNRIVNNAANVNAALDGGGIYCFVASGEISGNVIPHYSPLLV